MRKILLIILCFVFLIVFVSCSPKLPDGIENKDFYKDLDNLLATMVKSFQTKTYKKELDSIIEKMNDKLYKDKLNNYELSILDDINKSIPLIKHDLEIGNHTLKSETFDKIKWIFDIFEQ